MTVEDIKSADTESLEEWFENGSWKSFPEDAQRELLARISDYRVHNSGEWDTPIISLRRILLRNFLVKMF
jgi:hypothetical protein